ncbi:hypothetical protein HBI32_126770 [Parastagonospora nodorum]|nr:hypothetical protein HBI32_126770 [Parastagonospora nodorum]
MCAKDDLIRRKMLFQTHNRRLAGEPATAESITAKDPNHVDTFSSDFTFSPLIARGNVSNANILSLIAFIISHRLFADELVYAPSQFFSGNTDYPNIQQSLLDRATVVLIIISVNKTQLLLISGDVAAYTLLARFIPTTKIRDPLLKSQVYYYCIGKLLSPLENAAKSRILLACADRRTRQCYPTILLLTSVKKNRHCTRCTKHYNFNIHVSLATDTLHLLLKGLVIKMLDFMQDMLDDIYPSKQKAIIQQLIAVVSPLFVSKAPFALHFIRAVYNLVTLAQYKSHDEDTLAYIQGALERMNVFKEEFQHALTHIIQDIRMYGALDSICTKANSEAHHITIVKQFYSMTNKKEYILQICLHNSQRTALLAADYATVVKQSRPSTTSIPGIQPHSTKLPLSEVAANIAISDFTHAAAVFIRNKRQAARSSGKRHNDPKHCDEEVQEFKHRDNRRQSRTVTDSRVVAQLYLILTIINYTRYDKDGKHIAYIRAFSEVLLFNNNGQIDNTTRMLTFKFYDLSTIIRLVHLVPRDLPNSTTHTTMSYYVNNYIN